MRKPMIAGNWKMNKTPAETKTLIEDLKKIVNRSGAEVVVCPMTVCLAAAAEARGVDAAADPVDPGVADDDPAAGASPAAADPRGITEQQFRNRMILRAAMLRHGFKPLDSEWWHFTLKAEPYPDTYFTFPVKQL